MPYIYGVFGFFFHLFKITRLFVKKPRAVREAKEREPEMAEEEEETEPEIEAGEYEETEDS